MTYACALVQQPALPTLVVRTRAPVRHLSDVLGPAWGSIIAYAGSIGATPSGPPFVGYHNMDMSDLDLEIGFPFAQAHEGGGDVLAGDIPAGPAVETLHVGPYDAIGDAYEALRGWMTEHAYAPAGPAYEHYLNDPQKVAPEALRTRVVWPVR